jgi:hypothetical protein
LGWIFGILEVYREGFVVNTYVRLVTSVSIVALGLFGSSVASADFYSRANLYSTIFDPSLNRTIQGWDLGAAELSGTGSATPGSGILQETAGWSLASAETGRLAFTLVSAIDVASDASPSSALSANIQSTNNTIIDDFSVGAGGGLQNGDAANVLLQVRLDVEYQLQGRPSGGMMLNFSVNAGEGINVPELINYSTGGLSPPVADMFSLEWNLLVPVTVGQSVRVDARMDGWINGTAFDRGESGLNYLFADPIFRVTNAPEYDLNIVSSAGASTSPIPIPPAFWLLGFGIIGLIGAARRKA